MDIKKWISNTIGYHVNDSDRCKEFVENGKLIFAEDITFLGSGMYFWDNEHNSKEWMEKKTRDGIFDSTIVTGRIETEAVLDLTDRSVVDNINRLWKKYSLKKRTSAKYINKEPLGLGLALDVLPLIKDCSVRKGILEYSDKNDPFPALNHGAKTCKFTTSDKVIYMVNDSKYILERGYLNN